MALRVGQPLMVPSKVKVVFLHFLGHFDFVSQVHHAMFLSEARMSEESGNHSSSPHGELS